MRRPGPRALARRRQVHERELKTAGAVEIVEEVAPRIEDCGLVLLLAELIVDVLKADCFRVIALRDAADAVRVHPLERDAALGAFAVLIRAFCPGERRVELFFFGAGELLFF